MGARLDANSARAAFNLTASTKRNIQPTYRIHGHPVAGADDDRRGLGLDDSGPFEGVARFKGIKRENRHLAPRAEKRLPRRARRSGRGRWRRPLVLAAP